MIPKCRIKTYTGAVLDYTLDDEAKSVHVHDVLNDLGIFNFVLPTVKGTIAEGYKYGDIAVYDKAYFYFWDAEVGSCPANPQFIGRVSKISAPLSSESGYYRVFEGKLLTEILQRRLKRNKSWIATDASVIVTELANDLSLGTGDIATDTTDVTLYVDVESYLDVLKKVSDYWYSAGVQIKKDFYVDVDNDLVWKTRPLRSAGVETLAVGTNISSYNVLRDVESVRNYIRVFGTNGSNAQAGRCEPISKDAWTYGAVWTDDYGTSASNDVDPQYGPDNLILTSEEVAGQETIKIYHAFSEPIQGMGRSGYQLLRFIIRRQLLGAAPTTAHLRLTTSAGNYFYRDIVAQASNLTWNWVESNLGDSQEYDADLNPNGVWQKTGTPDWYNINNIEFYFFRADTNNIIEEVDALYLSRGRFRHSTSDATSISNYGQRDFDMVDDNLKSDAECQTRAETLLFQLKDAPIRIDIETSGNTNILIGDQLSMTIPTEGISVSAYDVLSVEHDFSKDEFKTKVSMVNSSVTPTLINIRQLPCGTPYESMLKKFNVQREIGRGVQIIK